MLRSDAWLQQARSDLLVVRLLREEKDASLLCHIVAKLQQCIEKTIKGLADLLSEKSVLTLQIGRSHDVSRFMSAFIRLPRNPANKEVQYHIHGVFDQDVRKVIAKLDQVFPRWPVAGQPFERNTEYPFEQGGTWTCPCKPDVFAPNEVDEYQQVAVKVLSVASKIRSALNRRP